MQFTTKLSLALLLLLALGLSMPVEAQVCDEFISRANCQVPIRMGSVAGEVTPQYKVAVPAQSDIMINSGGTAVTILQQASPFLACSIAATPGAPTRDLSASVTAALTTFSGLVIPNAPPPLAPHKALVAPPVPSPGEISLMAIDAESEALYNIEAPAFAALADIYDRLRLTLGVNWRYSFATEPAARLAVTNLVTDLTNLLNNNPPVPPLPDVAGIQVLSKKLQTDLAAFYDNFTPPPGSSLEALARRVGANAASVAGNADLLQGGVSDFKKKVKQYLDFLANVPALPQDITAIRLPMARYKQKAVTETVTCKDAVSGAQPFDSIVYTAYYENTPIFDISAGAIISLLPGRQVGTVSGPLAPGTPAAGAMAPTSGPCVAYNPSETCLGITSSTRPQFMPAAFFELHPINERCPWATNGEPRHPFGYVCSLGLAGGFAVNPNNGTGSGEFFEGVSLGIQRVAFLLGIHNGRYQTFADGYYVGEAVPSGITARTERIWTNHFAIGIAYRIPLR